MEKNTYVYGIRAIIMAIQAGKSIDKVFLQKGLKGKLFAELEQHIHSAGLATSYVPIEKLNRLVKGNHQGAVASVAPIPFYNLDDLVSEAIKTNPTPLFLLLDQLSDVRNFGAIIRTAACVKVSGIIIPKKGGAPIHSDTIKTSAGAIFKVPISKVDHIKDAIYHMQASNIKVIAATEKANKLVYDTDFTSACSIVMGSENLGISPSVLKLVDDRVKLPILGDIASLNVSVACGAVLYEAVRQRKV